MVLISVIMNLHGLDHYDENTWWDCVRNDMESLGRPKMMHSPGINGGELREQRLTWVHLEYGC